MFGFHPVNLAFRFLLEVVGLVAMAVGAWSLASGPWWLLLAVAVPLAASVAWATFRVPGDGSASGDAPVPVPGVVRLMIEIDVFAISVFLLWFAWPTGAMLLGLAVIAHYALSVDRIRWLLAH